MKKLFLLFSMFLSFILETKAQDSTNADELSPQACVVGWRSPCGGVSFNGFSTTNIPPVCTLKVCKGEQVYVDLIGSYSCLYNNCALNVAPTLGYFVTGNQSSLSNTSQTTGTFVHTNGQTLNYIRYFFTASAAGIANLGVTWCCVHDEPQSGDYCSNFGTMTVEVFDPSINYSLVPNPICAGSNSCLTIANPLAAANYTFTSGNGQTQSNTGGAPVCFTYNTPATYTTSVNSSYVISATKTCTATKSATLNVVAPTITITETKKCEGVVMYNANVNGCTLPSGAVINWYVDGAFVGTGTSIVNAYNTPGLHYVTINVESNGVSITSGNINTSLSENNIGVCCKIPGDAGRFSGTLPAVLTGPPASDADFVSVPNTIYTFNSSTINNDNFLMYHGTKIKIAAGSTINFNNCHFYACSRLWEGFELEAGVTANFTNCVIEDALVGIKSSLAGSIVSLNNCIFNSNATDVYYKHFTNSFLNVQKTIFTSRELTFPSNLTLSLAAQPFNANTSYTNISASPQAALLPHQNYSYILNRSIRGIDLYGGTIGNTSPNNINLFAQANIYDLHEAGIYNSEAISLTIRKQQFYNIKKETSNIYVGAGILSINALMSTATNLNIGGVSALANKFVNCDNGIFTEKRIKSTIKGNNFISCKYGITVSKTNNLGTAVNCLIQLNNFTDNTHSCVFFYDNQQIFASVATNTAVYSSTATRTITSKGVEVMEFSQNANAKYLLSSNTFNNVNFGIIGYNTNGLEANANNVTLNADPTFNNHFNQGVNLSNCVNSKITLNNVTGTNNVYWWEAGLFAAGGANNDFSCNNVNNTFTGIGFNGSSSADVYRNDFDNIYYGAWLNAGTVIGPQDLPTAPGQPSDNRFTNVLQYHSYTSNGTDGSQNRFYIRTSSPEFNMTQNVGDNSFNNFTMTPFSVSSPLAFTDACTGGDNQRILSIKTPIKEDILYPQPEKALRLASKRSLYDFYKKNPSMLDASDIDFVNAYANEIVGKLFSIDEKINMGQLAQAMNDNNALVANDNVEQLQKEVNSLYLQNPSNNLARLKEIAAMCPFSEGTAVFQARAMLKGFDETMYLNPCEMGQLTASVNRIANTNSVNNTETLKAILYPNPSSGVVNLSLVGKAKLVNITIYNLLGSTVYTKEVSMENTQDITIDNLETGVYIVKIVADGLNLDNQRLIITK